MMTSMPPISRPAFFMALIAAGDGAMGMKPGSTRDMPKPRISTSMPGSVATARARSRVVTMAPALPSAGWVWPPKVMVPPSFTSLSRARPSAVVGKMPSSTPSTPVCLRNFESDSGASTM
ncbi:hypothetical protein D9M69_591410 [compost metagenome]